MTNLVPFNELLEINKLTEKEQDSLKRRTLGYIFRFISYNEYSKFLYQFISTETTPAQVRKFVKKHVLYNGTLMLNVKHWLFNTVARGKKLQETYYRYGLSVVDLEDWLPVVNGPFLSSLKELAKVYKPVPMKETQEQLAKCWADNIRSTERFTYSKLRFVAQQNGESLQSLSAELMSTAIAGLRHTWPRFETELHMQNIFRRAIHNTGINIIEKATTQKHARLINNNGEFVSLNVNLEHAAMLGCSELSCNIEGGKFNSSLDLKLTLDIYRNNLSKKKKLVLDSLYTYSPNFTCWLVDKGYIASHECNEALRDRVGLDKYLQLTSKWVGVAPNKVYSFVCVLKRTLAPFVAS